MAAACFRSQGTICLNGGARGSKTSMVTIRHSLQQGQISGSNPRRYRQICFHESLGLGPVLAFRVVSLPCKTGNSVPFFSCRQKTVVADFNEAERQDVQTEPAKEFYGTRAISFYLSPSR